MEKRELTVYCGRDANTCHGGKTRFERVLRSRRARITKEQREVTLYRALVHSGSWHGHGHSHGRAFEAMAIGTAMGHGSGQRASATMTLGMAIEDDICPASEPGG